MINAADVDTGSIGPLHIEARAMTRAEAEQRAGLARTRGVVTGVNFCYRYYPLPRPTFDTGVEEMRIRDAVLSSRRAGSWAKVG